MALALRTPTVSSSVLVDIQGPVCAITLNKPEMRNAFDEQMLADLHALFIWLGQESRVRVVVLRGAGRVFCAGADFSWMQRMASFSFQENIEDATRLAECLQLLAALPQAVICLVQGAAMGGGLGLMAAADIVIAAEDAQFGFPEVRLGLAPATIAPYVLRRLSAGRARELFLTARRFDAQQALAWNFIDYAAPAEGLAQTAQRIIKDLLKAGPRAVSACKTLLPAITTLPPAAVLGYTAETIAELRVSEEGQAGLRAAITKEPAPWVEKSCFDVF